MDAQLSASFLQLVSIMDELREKCPWDKKQTIQSLRQLTIEEIYELADSITAQDWEGIKEELGDLLLHIVFYAKIGTEEGRFTLNDVIKGISEKLIARHPHVYNNLEVKDEEEVKYNWEKLKLKEGKKSVLEGVPKLLPSIIKSMRLQEKAMQVGFEWNNKEEVWQKVDEETNELKEAVISNDKLRMEEEFGDLLFSLVNYARFLQIDADNALERTNKKFIERFTKMEEVALRTGKNLNEMTLNEMDAIWDSIKRQQE